MPSSNAVTKSQAAIVTIVVLFALIGSAYLATISGGPSSSTAATTTSTSAASTSTTGASTSSTAPQMSLTTTTLSPAGTPSTTLTATTEATTTTAPAAASATDLVQYCFSPGGNCKNVLIFWIGRANSTIHILIYSFTLDDVRDVLIQARNRGVDVKLVMEGDNVNGTGSEYYNLRNAGIDIRHDTRSALMHDKVAMIDNHIIITGSFNWTASANNSNNENMVVLDSQNWATAFETTFQVIYQAAVP